MKRGREEQMESRQREDRKRKEMEGRRDRINRKKRGKYNKERDEEMRRKEKNRRREREVAKRGQVNSFCWNCVSMRTMGLLLKTVCNCRHNYFHIILPEHTD